jgi:hypothetical protein
LATRWALRRVLGRVTRITGKMSLKRTPESLPDPKYWGNVVNMLIMVLVLMKVLSQDEVQAGISWVKALLAEL